LALSRVSSAGASSLRRRPASTAPPLAANYPPCAFARPRCPAVLSPFPPMMAAGEPPRPNHPPNARGGRARGDLRAYSTYRPFNLSDLPEHDKVLHLVRHGVTEMNVYLSTNAWDAPDFVDPLLYDTRLTTRGEAQARDASTKARALHPPPEVLLASPLTRALKTAELVFTHAPADALPRVVVAEARERLWHSAEVGRHPPELEKDFPTWDHSALDHIWWHTGGTGDPKAIVHEPEDVFLARMRGLVDHIASRPERSIALVCHWGVLQALTGRDFENCEIFSCTLSELSGWAKV